MNTFVALIVADTEPLHLSFVIAPSSGSSESTGGTASNNMSWSITDDHGFANYSVNKKKRAIKAPPRSCPTQSQIVSSWKDSSLRDASATSPMYIPPPPLLGR